MHNINSDTPLKHFLSVLREKVYRNRDFIPLHEPCLRDSEVQRVKNCVESGWVSTVGNYVNDFEEGIKSFTKSKYVIATSSGTASLHLALLGVGVKANEEVLLPALTFVATANAISYTGAIPHFVDCDNTSLGVDPVCLEKYLNKIVRMRNGFPYNKETERKISAILPVHMYGHPCSMVKIIEIANKFNIKVVEDAAEALGSSINGNHVGTLGEVGILSFNGNKIITTGGGGAVLTNNEQIALKIRHISTQAKKPHKWAYDHDETGYNYRLPNLNAALGLAQLENIREFIDLKRKLALEYFDVVQDFPGVSLLLEPKNTKSNYWLCSLFFEDPKLTNQFLEASNNMGVMTRPAWTLLNKLPMFKKCPSSGLSKSANVVKRLVNIPSSAKIILDRSA